jgi:hypothetical protein
MGSYNYIKKGNVREALINSAVDEALARSIYEMISQNKTGRQLERLKLWTKNAGIFGSTSYAVDTVTRSISRSWLIERLPRDDREEITVKELAQRAREKHERESRGGLDDVVQEIYHSIWPRKDDSESWRDDWSSFPLIG